MRILHVAEAFGGGVYELTRLQAEGAVAAGHEVAIAYGRRPETPQDVRSAVDTAVEVIPMPWTSRTGHAQVRAARALRRLVDRWRPDVVHLQSSFAGLHGALVVAGRVPTVYTPQGYAFTMGSERAGVRRAYELLERLVARRVDLIAASSAAEADQARYVCGARRVAIVENGIPELDAGALPEPARPAAPRVIAVGRLRPQRRPEACARILSAVADVADVRWVGGGGEQSPGMLAMRAAGISVTGWMPREQLMAELGGATIYLHWTAWDGLPLSILEAMARDVAVVASDIAPNREVVGPGQVRRTEEEAVALMRALLFADARREDVLASQRVRRRHYSAERMVAQYLDVYERVRR